MHKRFLPIAMLAVAIAFYFYEFLLRVAPGTIFSDLMREFQIDATNLGLLSSFYFLSYAALQLPVGVWMDQMGPRRLLTLAIILCSVSTILFAGTNSFALACVARLFIGAGSAFAFISCMKIVTLWFPPHRFGMLAGWTLAFGTMGAVFGESPLAIALQWTTWRELLFWIGVLGLGLAVLAWCIVRDENTSAQQITAANSAPSEVSVIACLKHVCRRKENWIIALYALMTTAPTDAFGGMWGIPYLVHVHGIDEASAATAVSMAFIGLAVGSPSIGWSSDSLKSRKIPMTVAALIATLSLTILIYAPSLTVVQAGGLFFTFGLFGVYVMSFVAARDINPSEYVGTMVGFVNMAAMIGSTLMMYLVGVVLDYVHQDTGAPVLVYTAHDYHIGLSIFPVAYAICAFILLPLMKESYPVNADTA